MAILMNNPADYVDEMLDGLVAAHPSLARAGEGRASSSTGTRPGRRASGSSRAAAPGTCRCSPAM